jgi:serine protease
MKLRAWWSAPVLALAGLVLTAATPAMADGVGMAPLHGMGTKNAHASARPVKSTNLTYHGGAVETAPVVYLVEWGWNGVDPSGEGAYYSNFLNHVGGTSWANSTTQYCQGVASGTVFCGTGGTHVGNPSGILKGTWVDNTNAIPSSPTQSALAAEAVRAAAFFGNTTSGSNASAQYIIATPHGKNTNGFGTSFCAWHSSTSSLSYGNIAYTNLPYITDAGANCGANSVNTGSAGLLDGVSIVGGHELMETVSDQYPSSGWVDGSGAENGDKCAWKGLANVSLNGAIFPVQPLWSNLANNGAGGCVLSF